MNKVIEGFKAMGLGEKIIVVAGVVLFIDGFLPWYSVDLGFASVTRSGWESPGAFWSILAVLIGIAMAAVVALKNLTDVAIPDNLSGVSWPKIYLGGGVVALASVLIKWLNENSYMGFGFYLGIVAAVALAGAGVYAFLQEKSGLSQYIPPQSDAPANANVSEKIERLAALRDKGALTDEEFEKAKAEALARK